eukprot:CAMPEP_0172480390 /NCGR_PEP_ID=MMETSP1066-20121228/5488_1 /TAXON_ID=671091 /ORGANISM="Coscinodiscus wailesii, Strain CCMP2513" /LENGTH=1957 /DNA_ID=CAMNT_0013241639 /DNA_START=101 /DNA_END=5974 /DNA_ORIENTATION=+
MTTEELATSVGLSPRRSRRTRHQPESIYDDAALEMAARGSMRSDESRRSKRPRERDASDDDSMDKEENDNDSSSDENSSRAENQDSEDDDSSSSPSESDVEDAEFQSQPTPAKTPTKRTPNALSRATPAKTLVQVATTRRNRKQVEESKLNQNRKALRALRTLSKKILHESETPTSPQLLPQILSTIFSNSARKPTIKSISQKVIKQHNDDPNAAQCLLLNLLFRSVGGSIRNNIDPASLILEEMDNDDWARIVTDLVDEMRHTQPDRILLHASPIGVADSSNKGGTGASVTITAGCEEYRRLYTQFWFVLGSTALEEGGMASDSTTRFDTELIRDLILRVTELVSVGQPDVRSAATLAALQMGHAILEKTLLLGNKLNVSTRQFAATKSSAKSEALRNTISTLKRTRGHLEEVCIGPIMQGVFVHRYRDSNPYIRSMCLDALSRMTIQRPDLFLCDKYLKYFGWMMSDKHSVVRCSAVNGLLAPFLTPNIDLGVMEHVIAKFLPRMADAVIDVSVSVQEKAIQLLLALLREGFLDDVEDEHLWNQINLRAIARDASPSVRRDALYFVMEQLEAFDEDDDNENATVARNKGLGESQERQNALRLDALASWLAHTLTDGPVSMADLQIDLANYLVYSVKTMPEHESLTTDWNVMLRAIREDSVATVDGASAGDRADVAKQRVLVQMLAEAARLEVRGVAGGAFLDAGMDVEMVDPEEEEKANRVVTNSAKKGRKNKGKSGLRHEALSVALLSSLPDLFIKFKTDATILTSLAKLPRYLISTVFSLPQRKHDVLALLKNLTDIFLSSTEEQVLVHSALALSYLSTGSHSRIGDAKRTLQDVAEGLCERLLECLKTNVPDKDSDEVLQRKKEREFTLSLNLLRLRIFCKRVDIAKYLSEEVLEDLTTSIPTGLVRRIMEWKDDGPWEGISDDQQDEHLIVARGVQEGLDSMLTLTAWRLHQVQKEENMVEDEESLLQDDIRTYPDEDYTQHSLVLLRNRLLSLIEACFELYLPETMDEDDNVPSHRTPQRSTFTNSIQAAATRTAADVRTLLPKIWSQASHPLLRAIALTSDWKLVGGSIRFFRSMEERLYENTGDDKASHDVLVRQLLLPLTRPLATNWQNGNRREAGVALSHITGSGSTSSHLISQLVKQLKKNSPIRLLEAHMACLRQLYEEWMDNEPEEPDSTKPTDAEMALFEEREREHLEMFVALEHKATRLAQTLGVGKLEKTLAGGLVGFVREGIRYAFLTDTGEGDGESVLVLGSRLSFLNVLVKYVTFLKKNKSHRNTLKRELDEKESELRAHPDFGEVHEDDLAALSQFRQQLGLKAYRETEATTAGNVVGDNNNLCTPSVSVNSRYSRGSASSMKSKLSSLRGELSPLYEEPIEDQNDHSNMNDEASTISGLSASQTAVSMVSTLAEEGGTPSVTSRIGGSVISARSLETFDEIEEEGDQDADDGSLMRDSLGTATTNAPSLRTKSAHDSIGHIDDASHFDTEMGSPMSRASSLTMRTNVDKQNEIDDTSQCENHGDDGTAISRASTLQTNSLAGHSVAQDSSDDEALDEASPATFRTKDTVKRSVSGHDVSTHEDDDVTALSRGSTIQTKSVAGQSIGQDFSDDELPDEPSPATFASKSTYVSRTSTRASPATPASKSTYASRRSTRTSPATPASKSTYASRRSTRTSPASPVSKSTYASRRSTRTSPATPASKSTYASRRSTRADNRGDDDGTTAMSAASTLQTKYESPDSSDDEAIGQSPATSTSKSTNASRTRSNYSRSSVGNRTGKSVDSPVTYQEDGSDSSAEGEDDGSEALVEDLDNEVEDKEEESIISVSSRGKRGKRMTRSRTSNKEDSDDEEIDEDQSFVGGESQTTYEGRSQRTYEEGDSIVEDGSSKKRSRASLETFDAKSQETFEDEAGEENAEADSSNDDEDSVNEYEMMLKKRGTRGNGGKRVTRNTKRLRRR